MRSSRKDVKWQIIGFNSDVKRFKTTQKAEEFVASQVNLVGLASAFQSDRISIFTDGSASKAGASAGWVVATEQRESVLVDLCVSVIPETQNGSDL